MKTYPLSESLGVLFEQPTTAHSPFWSWCCLLEIRACFSCAQWRHAMRPGLQYGFQNGGRSNCNLVPRAFSSTIFKMADRREKTLAGITWYKISKNLGDFYHVTFWEKPKQNGGEGEAKHRSKDALTLYTRQRWLRSKIKYYFNGCFDSGAGIFSICKFIPLSYSLYFW